MTIPNRKLIRRDELVGKDVYDSNVRKVGTVTDIGFSEDAKPVLVITNKDSTEMTLPMESVDRLGDIVLLRADNLGGGTQIPQGQPTASEMSVSGNSRICVKCGAVNSLSARFCTKCRNQFF